MNLVIKCGQSYFKIFVFLKEYFWRVAYLLLEIIDKRLKATSTLLIK